MAIQAPRHSITIEEFERMLNAGVFGLDARIELLRGEIIDMSPIGDRHLGCVMLLDLLLHEQIGSRASILVQSPIELPDNTRPYPDVCLLKWRDDVYRRKHVTYEDVILLIEVADTSLDYDMGDKLGVYAQA